MEPFIEEFLISEDNKNKLSSLNLETPQALLSMIKVNPYAIEQLIGKKDLEQIETHLWNKIPLGMPQENKNFSFPIMNSVFIDTKAPKLVPPSYDIEKRDELFIQLQNLKQHKILSEEEQDKIISLEQEIIRLMNEE